ncbi:substrate-binding domain-containing protein [Pseudoalteromonas denitrificans]|uniref:Monosaccharide ABC transporter substrate-binding protein, CUT2 family n=1 Tax=Pseudoalteromonas denitrificans DSM 6059 TaxID=1123010 RepID=A0A1I1U477_9GAMM|nr:substrate-binding domain-containing protein [Pseudoalteromonas denitrificans]SFD65646.1 monosaccharide ABC transporter substrate-binding protein, CUT2 family [Pseudoalteromonas denitrificans DSM 6059]
MKFVIFLLAFFAIFMLPANTDPELNIALIGKTKNDSFYIQSYKGCQNFAKKHSKLSCIYDGPLDYQDPRSQAIVVSDLIDKNIDGLIISVTDSNHLTDKALKAAVLAKIPVLTFDSDLLPKDQEYRMAYVGTNNQDFGRALGEYAKRIAHKDQRNICIHSGYQSTPNLNDRIKGVRFALSGGESTDRLSGNSGWSEIDRCPLYSLGKRKLAIEQLEFVLQKPQTVINIAVAGFAQFSPDYIDKISQYKDRISSKESIIISADTEKIQLEALAQGLSNINIGQRPYEMGYLAAQLLYQYLINKQEPEKEFYFLDFHYCSVENYKVCTSATVKH